MLHTGDGLGGSVLVGQGLTDAAHGVYEELGVNSGGDVAGGGGDNLVGSEVGGVDCGAEVSLDHGHGVALVGEGDQLLLGVHGEEEEKRGGGGWEVVGDGDERFD